MSKKATVYVIECQNSVGAWEINGPAFIDERAASRHVDMLTIEILANELDRDDFANSLGLDIEKDSKLLGDQGDETFSEIIDLLEQRDKLSLIYEAADELQCGGYYSYEAVALIGGD